MNYSLKVLLYYLIYFLEDYYFLTTLKKTYHLIAALTLMLFVGTIALPAGLAAASLTCDMKMSHTVPVCCATADMNSHQEKKSDAQDCEHQTYCEQVVDSSPSDTPAVTQSSKIVIAAELLEELTFIQEENEHPPAVKDESPSLHSHPPIFLLNSTFLN